MPFTCFICKKNKNHQHDIRLYKVPAVSNRGYVHKNQEITRLLIKRRFMWCKVLNITTTECDNVRICSNHFISGQPSAWQEEFSADWYPNKNLGHFEENLKSDKKNEEEVLCGYAHQNDNTINMESLQPDFSKSVEILSKRNVLENIFKQLHNILDWNFDPQTLLENDSAMPDLVNDNYGNKSSHINHSELKNVLHMARNILENASKEIGNIIDSNFTQHGIEVNYVGGGCVEAANVLETKEFLERNTNHNSNDNCVESECFQLVSNISDSVAKSNENIEHLAFEYPKQVDHVTKTNCNDDPTRVSKGRIVVQNPSCKKVANVQNSQNQILGNARQTQTVEVTKTESSKKKIAILQDEIVHLDLYKMLKAGIPTANTDSQTDLTGDEIEDIVINQKLSTIEKIELISKLSTRYIDKEYFKDDNKKTRYYTGLHTYTLLQHVFDAVREYLPTHHNCKLDKFQMLALTLMKLRLNLDFTDLGYRFGISTSSASHYFHKCIYVIYEKFNGSNLIYWPNKEDLVSSQPSYFKDCFKEKVTIVVDCFETPTQRPSNKKAAAQSFSKYKHHNTVKYLLGISLRGAIIFVSKAFGGRASDKHITARSGFLNRLKQGDYVLADRGFLIHEMVEEKKAKAFLPCFTKNKNQLSSAEVEATRYIAHMRIHVERLIGILKQKYRVFSETIKISALAKSNNLFQRDVMDKIVVVCCCLVNLCPPVINNGFW